MDAEEPSFAACTKCGRIITGDRTECSSCDSDLEWREADQPEAASPGRIVGIDTDVLGRRVVAALIDLVPLTVLLIGFASLWGQFGEQANGARGFALYGWAFIGFGVAALGYYFLQEALAATTFGKWAMGLRVVYPWALPIGPKAALIRSLMRVIDGLPFLYLVGFLSAVFDDREQRLGDKAAGSLVGLFRSPEYQRQATKRSSSPEADLVHPEPPSLVKVLAITVIATVTLGAGAYGIAVGDGGFRPLDPVAQETHRDALLTTDEVAASPFISGPVFELSISDASGAENPDPRGVCGSEGTGDVYGAEWEMDAVAFFQTTDLLIMNWLISGPDPMAVIEATLGDMHDGCPPFYSDTPYGHRQFNQYLGSVDLDGIGDAAVGTRQLMGPEGAAVMNSAEQAIIAVDEFVVVVSVLGVEELPQGLLADLAERAATKVQSFIDQ